MQIYCLNYECDRCCDRWAAQLHNLPLGRRTPKHNLLWIHAKRERQSLLLKQQSQPPPQKHSKLLQLHAKICSFSQVRSRQRTERMVEWFSPAAYQLWLGLVQSVVAAFWLQQLELVFYQEVQSCSQASLRLGYALKLSIYYSFLLKLSIIGTHYARPQFVADKHLLAERQ